MVHANKIGMNKHKSEFIIKLVGVYIRQKCNLIVNNISTKMCNINGGKFRINYIHVNHLVQLYEDSIVTYIHHLSSVNSTHHTDTSGGFNIPTGCYTIPYSRVKYCA